MINKCEKNNNFIIFIFYILLLSIFEYSTSVAVWLISAKNNLIVVDICMDMIENTGWKIYIEETP